MGLYHACLTLQIKQISLKEEVIKEIKASNQTFHHCGRTVPVVITLALKC